MLSRNRSESRDFQLVALLLRAVRLSLSRVYGDDELDRPSKATVATGEAAGHTMTAAACTPCLDRKKSAAAGAAFGVSAR
jgi:hypothetical protein